MSKRKPSDLSSPKTPKGQSALALDAYTSALSAAEREGQAIGHLLSSAAAHALLTVYNNRRECSLSPASQAHADAFDRLRSVLGAMANDADVAAALQQIDDAYGNAIVEIEDRAWHAAWTTVTGIAGGQRHHG